MMPLKTQKKKKKKKKKKTMLLDVERLFLDPKGVQGRERGWLSRVSLPSLWGVRGRGVGGTIVIDFQWKQRLKGVPSVRIPEESKRGRKLISKQKKSVLNSPFTSSRGQSLLLPRSSERKKAGKGVKTLLGPGKRLILRFAKRKNKRDTRPLLHPTFSGSSRKKKKL